MIIVKFHGGLGNQMYQYAFYTMLCNKYREIPILADLSRYEYAPYIEHNGFELFRIFKNIDIRIASRKEIMMCGGEYERKEAGAIDVIKKYVWNNFGYYYVKNRRVQEKDITGNELDFLISNRQNVWLCGYWCDFPLGFYSQYIYKQCLDKENQKVLDMSKGCEAVSIHVRRGDYVGTSFDIVSSDYYLQAIDYINNVVENPFFYVFSDDMEYVKALFSDIDRCYIVDINRGNESYKDMQLMSECKHNIICNSTFSTWGAYLNSNPYKYVIVPKVYENQIVKDNIGQWVIL